MSKRILLVGCGQLGSRHLQALVALKDVAEIFVLDPNPASLELGQFRVREVADANPNIRLSWFDDMSKIPVGGDLCLMATQAQGRGPLFKKIAQDLCYRIFMIEKIVTPSLGEYQDLVRFSEQHGIRAWVNCQTRTFSVDQYIKRLIRPEDPVILSDVGGNHGLATYGVHVADLFLHFDGSSEIKLARAQIEPALHPSKRGKDLFDLSGIITGYTEKGSHLLMSFSGAHKTPDIMNVITPRGRFMVDHIHENAYQSLEEAGWKWQQIPIDGNWVVSRTTREIATDILFKGMCALPTLKECYPAHDFILSTLKPHFEKLMGKQLNSCPVT